LGDGVHATAQSELSSSTRLALGIKLKIIEPDSKHPYALSHVVVPKLLFFNQMFKLAFFSTPFFFYLKLGFIVIGTIVSSCGFNTVDELMPQETIQILTF